MCGGLVVEVLCGKGIDSSSLCDFLSPPGTALLDVLS